MENSFLKSVEPPLNNAVLFLGYAGCVPDSQIPAENHIPAVRAELDIFIHQALKRGRTDFIANSNSRFAQIAAEMLLELQKRHPQIRLAMVEPIQSPKIRADLHEKADAAAVLSEKSRLTRETYLEYAIALLPCCAELATNAPPRYFARIMELQTPFAGMLRIMRGKVQVTNLYLGIHLSLHRRKSQWADQGEGPAPDAHLLLFLKTQRLLLEICRSPTLYLDKREKVCSFIANRGNGGEQLRTHKAMAAMKTVLNAAIDQAVKEGRTVFLVNSDSYFTQIAGYLLMEKKKANPDIRLIVYEVSSHGNPILQEAADYACAVRTIWNDKASMSHTEFLAAHSAVAFCCMPDSVLMHSRIQRFGLQHGCHVSNLRSEIVRCIEQY